ncbi:MAG: late competence development ComFB family protein [Candidatus Omnitrophota bacterium]
MQVHNYMEDIVEDELDELFSEIEDICKCQKCKFDIMVWALNRLPPNYVITDKGRMFTKLKEQDTQFRADVVKEITKAILYISKNPRH